MKIYNNVIFITYKRIRNSGGQEFARCVKYVIMVQNTRYY